MAFQVDELIFSKGDAESVRQNSDALIFAEIPPAKLSDKQYILFREFSKFRPTSCDS
jgi:hypothetical protein